MKNENSVNFIDLVKSKVRENNILTLEDERSLCELGVINFNLSEPEAKWLVAGSSSIRELHTQRIVEKYVVAALRQKLGDKKKLKKKYFKEAVNLYDMLLVQKISKKIIEKRVKKLMILEKIAPKRNLFSLRFRSWFTRIKVTEGKDLTLV